MLCDRNNHAFDGEADGLAEGEGAAAFASEVLIAFNSTMDVYLFSSE